MNLKFKTAASWINVSVLGLASASNLAAAGHPSVDTLNSKASISQQEPVVEKLAVLYIDYDNIVSKGELLKPFQKHFHTFLESIKQRFFIDQDLRVKLLGNFRFHFPAGHNKLDEYSFRAWSAGLPEWCELIDTPCRKTKSEHNGIKDKTKADPEIMYGMQHDAYHGHPVALLSNDVDFDVTLLRLQMEQFQVSLLTNKICNKELLKSVPRYFDAREAMLDAGLSGIAMAASELAMLPSTLNFSMTRSRFQVYARNNWCGTGSFKALLAAAEGAELDYSEHGKIHRRSLAAKNVQLAA